MISNQYYSQYGQDQFLDRHVFTSREPGFFIDIGAHDGICFSNTYVFEKYRQWNGICVEPLPAVFEKLKENRKCILIQGAVGMKTGKEKFLSVTGYPEMLSGLLRNYNKKHKDRIAKEINQYGGASQVIEVESYNINELLKKNAVSHVSYCNIDTEGSEFEILSSIDFNHIMIDVFTIEGNYRFDKFRIILFLLFKGYRFVGSLMSDMIFVHKRLNLPISEMRRVLAQERTTAKARVK